MKDIIISKIAKKQEKQLVVRNGDKIAKAEIAKMSSSIDLDSQYMWAISNIDYDAVRNLGLISIKKNQRFAGQIKKKVNELQKDQIPALTAFVKRSWKTNNNKKLMENMKIRHNIDFKQVSSIFDQLHGSIHYQKIDMKDISEATKLIKELVRFSLVWGNNRCSCQDHIWIEEEESIYKPTNEEKP